MNNIFLEGGLGRSENIYVWGYDKIMIFDVLGSHFYQFGAFLRSKYRFGKCFFVAVNFKYFLGMPDIPYIFGDKE